MVHAGEVEGFASLHSPPAQQEVADRFAQKVAHGQRARHVGRGDRDHVRIARPRRGASPEHPALLPERVPPRLDQRWVVGLGERLRRGLRAERVDLAGLGDVPVLAEPAGQVTAGGAERQHRRTGQEVVERLLLHRVDAEPGRPAVAGQHDLVGHPAPDEAQPALPLVQLAGARAHIALHPTVIEAVPVARRNVRRDQIGHSPD